MSALQDETAQVLSRLIAFNTVNPPGNERACQEWLARYLTDAGFACELLGAEPERQNLVARLSGSTRPGGQASRSAPTLGLLSHVDTVLATPEDWQRDPWSGEVDEDGFLWGRGAIDMKSQTAAEVVAAASLAREGWRPNGELLVLVVADEEVGGRLGAMWLCENHPEKVRCDYLLNEGGGGVIPYAGRRVYGVCCAEKGTFRFSVTTRGRAGHASLPRMGDNALLKLAPIVECFADRTPGYDVPPEAAAFLTALGEDPDDPRSALEHIGQVDRRLAVLLEPMLGVTFAPTQIHASDKINVIPAHAQLRVDCRVPPGLGTADARRRIEEVIGREGYELAFIEEVVGNRSPTESPLMDAIRDWASGHEPGAEVVPTMLPAFTDSRTFRDTFPDCVAYGFFPQSHMSLFDTAPLVHGRDERIDVRDLGVATDCYRSVARRLLG